MMQYLHQTEKPFDDYVKVIETVHKYNIQK